MSEASGSKLIAGMEDDDVLAIVGPAFYKHFWTVCGESTDCIQDLCIEGKKKAQAAQAKRIENLRHLLVKTAKVQEAREQYEIITTFGVQGI